MSRVKRNPKNRWPCRCVARDAKTGRLAVKLNHETRRMCGVCKTKRG